MITAGVEGGSWDRIDETMTIPRFNSLQTYWKKRPPVHESTAAIAFGLGVLKPKVHQPVPQALPEGAKPAGDNSHVSRAEFQRDLQAANIMVPGVKRHG